MKCSYEQYNYNVLLKINVLSHLINKIPYIIIRFMYNALTCIIVIYYNLFIIIIYIIIYYYLYYCHTKKFVHNFGLSTRYIYIQNFPL